MPELLIIFLSNPIARVALVIFVAYITQKVTMAVVINLIKKSVRLHHKKGDPIEEKREKTLINIIGNALKFTIGLMALLMALQELGVNIAPLLAGAGVIGVALGFGAQSLVQDAFKGLFIIFENQYRVGDVVEINGDISGVAEKITLRATVLRDLDGNVHHISNGNIQTATNMTMEFANVNIDIGISYDSDLAKVEKVINETGKAMASHKDWEAMIIEPPQFLRVDSFDDSAITVKILGKTTADMRWGVAGEFRKRLKRAFDENDIEIPFPQMVIHDQRTQK